jgi:predicted house-cleaning noncanonical NTP pyrophosphatase (MazG superfamily)
MKKVIVLIIGFLIGFSYYYFMCEKSHKTATDVVQDRVAAFKMRKFIHNKLWRDSGPARMEAVGSIVHVRILDDVEYNKQLGLKLMEEAAEAAQAACKLPISSIISDTEKADLISEIGDVYEVIDCMIALHNLSREEIASKQAEKRNERGSLLERKFVTMTESIPGSFLDEYCSKDPDKYLLIPE